MSPRIIAKCLKAVNYVTIVSGFKHRTMQVFVTDAVGRLAKVRLCDNIKAKTAEAMSDQKTDQPSSPCSKWYNFSRLLTSMLSESERGGSCGLQSPVSFIYVETGSF